VSQQVRSKQYKLFSTAVFKNIVITTEYKVYPALKKIFWCFSKGNAFILLWAAHMHFLGCDSSEFFFSS
jgi:hypothetical protein